MIRAGAGSRHVDVHRNDAVHAFHHRDSRAGTVHPSWRTIPSTPPTSGPALGVDPLEHRRLLMVTVPETIIRSEWRGEAHGHTQAFDVEPDAKCHHLDRAAARPKVTGHTDDFPAQFRRRRPPS